MLLANSFVLSNHFLWHLYFMELVGLPQSSVESGYPLLLRVLHDLAHLIINRIYQVEQLFFNCCINGYVTNLLINTGQMIAA